MERVSEDSVRSRPVAGVGRERVMTPRDAFDVRDAEASRSAHVLRTSVEDGHSMHASRHIRQLVYGGLDGVISSFALVAATAGAGLPSAVLLMIGFANLVADAISMGIGSYLAAKAERDHILRERAREQWEYENYPEGEIAEMVSLYRSKGFSEEDADRVIGIYTSQPAYKEAFIDHMMVEELGYVVPRGDSAARLWLSGVATGLSFAGFGSLPLWMVAVLESFGNIDFAVQAGCGAAVTMVALFGLGICKARITREHSFMWWNGLLMMANGALAAVAAFLVGAAVNGVVGGRVTCTIGPAL